MNRVKTTLAGSILMALAIISCEKEGDDPVDCTTGGPSITAAATDAACGTHNGGLSITGTGGKQPYQYSLDNTNFQASNTFANLAVGDYTITVRDAAGCTSTTSTKVDVNPNSISFNATIKNIIETNCAISGCHVAGTGRPNYTEFSEIQSRAALIKTRTGNKSMPIGRTLTDEQIQQIACWVDAGAPNN